jgi:two-component SAPR family response regulator
MNKKISRLSAVKRDLYPQNYLPKPNASDKLKKFIMGKINKHKYKKGTMMV